MVEISIKAVLQHLENGVTRTTDSKNYNPELRSIEEIYELSKADVREMFKHPLLMNKKTKPPRAFTLIDDLTAELEAAQAAQQAATPSYGARPAQTTQLPTNTNTTDIYLTGENSTEQH
tara:strand:+ start:437 stop:793 length:357 start_codon:yes stop_codon:yes gene_type:complete